MKKMQLAMMASLAAIGLPFGGKAVEHSPESLARLSSSSPPRMGKRGGKKGGKGGRCRMDTGTSDGSMDNKMLVGARSSRRQSRWFRKWAVLQKV